MSTAQLTPAWLSKIPPSELPTITRNAIRAAVRSHGMNLLPACVAEELRTRGIELDESDFQEVVKVVDGWDCVIEMRGPGFALDYRAPSESQAS